MVQSVTPMPGAWDDDWSPTFDGSQVVRSDLQGNALGAVLGMEGVMITAEDATRLIPTTQESKRNDPNFARGGAVGERTGLRGKVLVVQGASEARFFEGSKNFDITDTQINSAGRDVNINSDVTANYFEDRSLSMIPYAEGAGIDTTKACLDGTRTAILAKVEDWLTATDIATPRVLWISGPAGTGKSAIAHTVARRWIIDKKGIGSCFCFNRQVVNRHQKLFSTIARDLAGRMPWLKAYLINLIAAEPALASTPDVTQQWQKLIEIPITSFAESITGPVTFVIDALDETGDGPSRRHILSILKKDVANLPSNFRILVTSRPLRDIIEAFCGASGIQHESMDQISRLSTECDIQFYISHQLQDISHDIDHQMLAQLTQKACGLFEWARLACEYIRYTGDFLTRREQCQQLIVHTGEGSVLLDDMYKVILQHIMGNHPKKVALSRFCSVLCLVLSTREPLPMESLDVLHKHMQKGHDCYGVATVLQHFGSLLSGISNQSMAICVLHSTFYEFLTSKDRSGIFWVDLVDVNLALGYACLEVMQQHLCFNICKLESSYVCNSEVIDLGQCINDHIKPYLSYSCHFWADHITLTPYQESLAGKVSAFLLNEKMLFWFEVLGLLNWTNIVPTVTVMIAT